MPQNGGSAKKKKASASTSAKRRIDLEISTDLDARLSAVRGLIPRATFVRDLIEVAVETAEVADNHSRKAVSR